jgi:tRNA threonylcarbamoyladenosine biosynthesis protein TsaE
MMKLTGQATYTLAEIDELAQTIASQLRGGEVLALCGDLGAGKTTFTQALARALGVVQPVLSPTFAIERQYQADNGLVLHHFDWYRLTDAAQVEELGVTEVMANPASVTVIEWPERARQLLPAETHWMVFEYVDTTTRRITFHT